MLQKRKKKTRKRKIKENQRKSKQQPIRNVKKKR